VGSAGVGPLGGFPSPEGYSSLSGGSRGALVCRGARIRTGLASQSLDQRVARVRHFRYWRPAWSLRIRGPEPGYRRHRSGRPGLPGYGRSAHKTRCRSRDSDSSRQLAAPAMAGHRSSLHGRGLRPARGIAGRRSAGQCRLGRNQHARGDADRRRTAVVRHRGTDRCPPAAQPARQRKPAHANAHRGSSAQRRPVWRLIGAGNQRCPDRPRRGWPGPLTRPGPVKPGSQRGGTRLALSRPPKLARWPYRPAAHPGPPELARQRPWPADR
jgi:hypothetical protein